MGRKKAFVWRHFNVLDSSGAATSTAKKTKSVTAICKYCSTKSTFANATRLTTHIASACLQCPKAVRDEAIAKERLRKNASSKRMRILSDSSDDEDDALHAQAVPSASNTTTATTSLSHSSSSTAKSPALCPSTSTAPMDRFASVTTNKLKRQIDRALARAIYVTPSVPFHLFENPYWKYALQLMRPSYCPPSGYQVRTPLLNQEYVDVTQSIKTKIQNAPCVAIISDGWTNIRGENLIIFLLTTPHPVFLKSVVPGTARETSEFIAKEIIKVIDELVEDGIDVMSIFLIVTDNASNMRAAWALVQQTHPHIYGIGCTAHLLDLLLSDLMKLASLLELKKNVKAVIKEFKNHHVISAVFKAEQDDRYGSKKVSLKFPPKTRWFYFVICLHSMKCNKAALQATVIKEDLKINKCVRDLILDNDNFWLAVNETFDCLVPLAKAISFLESDTSTLSDVPQLKKKLSEDLTAALSTTSVLTDDEKENTKANIVERFYKCSSDVHLAANLLHPVRMGNDLEPVDKQSAISFISQQCTHLKLVKVSVITNLAQFRTKTAFFSDGNIWEAAGSIPPSTWWGAFCTDQPLYPIAKRLFNVPPTSAANERNWSVHGNVHSKARNRLTNERVQKQVAIKCNIQYSSNALPGKLKGQKRSLLGTYNMNDVPDKETDTLDIDWDGDDSEVESLYSLSDSDSSDDDIPVAFLYPNQEMDINDH